MPRYFFHFFEPNTRHFLKDAEGTLLPNALNAKKEAIRLARDVVGHGLVTSTWQLVVTDENAGLALNVRLSEIRPSKLRPWMDWANRAFIYKPNLHSMFFTCLLVTTVFVLILQASLMTTVSRPGLALATQSPALTTPPASITPAGQTSAALKVGGSGTEVPTERRPKARGKSHRLRYALARWLSRGSISSVR